ncbi:fungal-specific transcription factor domain-containing protein [Coniochaeta sp. 2T2.1]|nr:fungal-specific transcription factor domain-containing protein [Coniochaeta sp. 2T2.1]
MADNQQCQLAGEPEDAYSDDGRSESTVALACNGCRKRKLRCSREHPTCQQCRRTAVQCVYETRRSKPGLKLGALEKVHKRLDALERIVHRRDAETQVGKRTTNGIQDAKDNPAFDILTLLARELPKLVKGEPECDFDRIAEDASRSGPQKRRRIGDELVYSLLDNSDRPQGIASCPTLPNPDCLDTILHCYFECIHPWIPMVHQARLRSRLAIPAERPKLDVLLHAIVWAASRFVSDQDVLGYYSSRSRTWVVTTAMDCMNVESLQALIIVGFIDIGSGNARKAWSHIGAMTRMVDYLQLTLEHEDTKRKPLLQPFMTLPSTDHWTEDEERRRVFWNVFNLDRFCSVAMGWNTSLTSDNVCRRLPCDGILWRMEQLAKTPFFGIWDKAAARIGNPITFFPSHSQPEVADSGTGAFARARTAQSQADTGPSSRPADDEADMVNVGAFGYCIEATESMSRVMSYFLQQPIDMTDQGDIRQWLTRFKELDLRLVHWKMLLPHRWKADSYIESRVAAPLVMDPNLTLAHVTHNTSMILLHQLIAFPPPGLSDAFRGTTQRLPSAYSAETCVAAATEIAIITSNYLTSTPKVWPVASQYAFCVYIAARILLVYWRSSSNETELSEEFWALVRCLDEFSSRWSRSRSKSEGEVGRRDLAQNYSATLRELHKHCTNDKELRVSVAAYTTEVNYMATGMDTHNSHDIGYRQRGQLGTQDERPLERLHDASEYMQMAPQPAMPGLFFSRMSGSEMVALEQDFGPAEDRLNAVPQVLLDPDFLDLDRIISFDDGMMFAATIDDSGRVW